MAEEKEEATETEQDNRGKKKAPERRRGKYTGASAKGGHWKFGGWSTKGMKRFNAFFALIKEDRTCPQATAMEGKLLEFRKIGLALKQPQWKVNGWSFAIRKGHILMVTAQMK